MARLILAFEDIAGGALKRTGLADRVIPFGWLFVWGPLPSPSDVRSNIQIDGLALTEFCARFDTIELWAGPEPNAQLQLVWLLDHLRSDVNVVSRSLLVQSHVRIGGESPAEWVKQRRWAVPVHSDHLEIASAAWAAWRAPTPVAWFDLLTRDLSAVPQLRSTVNALLEELPMRATGLGATEMRMLELLAAGHEYPYDLFPDMRRRMNAAPTAIGKWASCSTGWPVVLGLQYLTSPKAPSMTRCTTRKTVTTVTGKANLA